MATLLLMAMIGQSTATNTLFKRQKECVKCERAQTDCPKCNEGESCVLTIQTCDKCAEAICMADEPEVAPTTTGTAATAAGRVESGKGNATGPIIGGVVGGLIIFALVGYFLFRRYKKKVDIRQSMDIMSQHSVPYSTEKSEYYTATKEARNSTHTVHSIASTVMTRASNVIQIAYIPGVTNRSNPNSPHSLIPPVPPLPLNSPLDNRNSTYSQASTIPDRTSVATTIYRSHAIVSPVNAQPVRLGKANLVQVKSSSNSQASSPGLPPPVPQIDLSSFAAPPKSPAFSVGSTFLKKSEDDKEYLTPAANARISQGMAPPKEDESPFSDRQSLDTTPTPREGDIRISLRPMSEVELEPRPKSPFDDENKVN